MNGEEPQPRGPCRSARGNVTRPRRQLGRHLPPLLSANMGADRHPQIARCARHPYSWETGLAVQEVPQAALFAIPERQHGHLQHEARYVGPTLERGEELRQLGAQATQYRRLADASNRCAINRRKSGSSASAKSDPLSKPPLPDAALD